MWMTSKARSKKHLISLIPDLTMGCVSIEPIQSRCAVLRYSKLRDEQIMMRLMEVVEKENLHTTNDGLEAIIFTAQGDMRQVSKNTIGYTIRRNRSG